MPTVPETQSLIDEQKTPSQKTLAQANADLKAYVPDANLLQAQLVIWSDLSQLAEMAEPEEEITQKLYELQSKYRAMLSTTEVIRDHFRTVTQLGRQIKALETEWQAVCATYGYTV